MRQPQSYMTMLKREGRFRILRSPLKKNDIRMWHNCESYKDQDLVKNQTLYPVYYGQWWRSNNDSRKAEAWACSMCAEKAPEGLTGAYIMLDWERATNEIATVNDDYWNADLDLPF